MSLGTGTTGSFVFEKEELYEAGIEGESVLQSG